MLKTLHQLAGLFNNGKIRRKVRIENIVRTEPAKQRNHLSFHKAAVGHAEFFAKRNPHRWRSTENDNLRRILDRSLHKSGLRNLLNRSGRAYICTLSAMNTYGSVICLFQIVIPQNRDIITAHVTTVSALDAFVFNAFNRRISRLNRNANLRR